MALDSLLWCRLMCLWRRSRCVNHAVDVGVVVVALVVTVVNIFVGSSVPRQWRPGVDPEGMNLLGGLHGIDIP
jgi:hypothetical protein